MVRAEKINRIRKISALIILTVFAAAGLLIADFVISTWLVLISASAIMIYCFKSMKNRLGLLLFVATMFFFLIGRPTLDVMSKYIAGDRVFYSLEEGLIANRMILMALIGLFLGHVVYEKAPICKKEKAAKNIFSDEMVRNIRNIALVFFLIGMIAVLMENGEKVLFRQTNSYEALYSSFQSQLPFVVRGFGEVSTTFMVLFLATSKNFRHSITVLAIYLGGSATLLLIGVRADFTRAVLFSLFILFLLLKDREQLSPKKMMRVGASFLILGIFLLGLLYTIGLQRTGQERNDPKFPFLIDFIYGQGVSYQTLTGGQQMIHKLPYSEKHYAFGPFLDQFVNDLPRNAYSLEYVEKGDSMAADLGYYLLGETEFLKGRGMGSSYIIEMYADFGNIGVLVFSLLLGALLGSLTQIFRRNILVDIVKIRILLDIFYIPRAPAIRFLVNLLSAKFILPIIVTLLLSKTLLLMKREGEPK